MSHPELPASELGPADEVALFPTWGWFDHARGGWRINVHAWAFAPRRNRAARALGLSAVRLLAKVSREAAQGELFRQRAGMFLVENLHNRRLTVRICGRHFRLPPTRANGHVYAAVEISPDDAAAIALGDPGRPQWTTIDLALPESDPRRISGAVQLITETGVSIVSDFDDTMRRSHATDLGRVIRKTFSEEFVDMPGMAQAYRRAAAAGAAWHYVSFTPWQLYRPVVEFCERFGFPAGSLDLVHFRLRDGSLWKLMRGRERFPDASSFWLVTRAPAIRKSTAGWRANFRNRFGTFICMP
jgi:hypothetical protein